MQRYVLWDSSGHFRLHQAPKTPLSATPPALAGGNAVVDGCGRAQNSPELATEEYALMSIDTIINGKVGVL